MTHRHRLGAATVALALLITVAGLGAQGAPALAIHVDMDAWNQGFPSSAIGQMWNSDPIVQQWRANTLTPFLQRTSQEGPDLETLLSHMTGQMAIALTMEPGQEPSVALGFHQPGQIAALLAEMQSQMTPADFAEMQTQMLQPDEDRLVFGNSPALSQAMADALPGGPEALGLQAAPGSFLSGSINLGQLLGVAQAQGDISPEDRMIMDELGLLNIDAIAFSSGFRGRGLASDAEVTFSGARQGLFTLVGENRSFGLTGLLPTNTLSMAALSLPPMTELWAWTESMIVRHGGPTAQQDLDTGLMQFQAATGLDLRTQVLPAIGQEFAFALGGATGMSLDAALIAEVNDPTVINQLITAVINTANMAMMGNAQPGAPEQIMIQPMAMSDGGIDYQMVTLPMPVPVQICYGIIGNHLVVTTTQAEMRAVILAQSSGQGLVSTPGFQAVASELAPQAALYTYSDSRQSAQTVSQAMMPLMMMSGAGMSPEMMQVLQQLPALAQHMGQKGSHLIVEPSRLAIHSHNTSGAEAVVAAMVFVAIMNDQMPMNQQPAGSGQPSPPPGF
jgi:Protein of unknown function (DUF3352)